MKILFDMGAWRGHMFSVLMIAVSLLVYIESLSAEEGKDGAMRHFAAGKALFTAEDYRSAAAEFQASVKLYPTQNGYYNWANCLKALHEYGEAIQVLDKMVSHFGNEMDVGIKERATALRDNLKSMVGTLSLKIEPDESSVALNGVAVGKSPLSQPLLLSPGTYSVEVSKPGFEAAKQQMTVLAQGEAAAEIQLKPLLGTVSLKIDEPGAEVTVNERVVGQAPLDAPLELAPGNYTISVSKNGFDTWQDHVSVSGGDTLRMYVPLTKMVIKTPVLPVMDEDNFKHPYRQFLIVGGAATGGLAVATAILSGLAGKYYSDGKDYDSQTVRVFDDDHILDPALDNNRHEAKDRFDALKVAGLAVGIATVMTGVATGTLWWMGRKKKEPAEKSKQRVSITSQGMVVRF